MFTLMRPQVLMLAAFTLMAVATAGTSTRAADMVQNLGPVGPHEPILATVGHKSLIAFYLPDNGGCDVQAVIWNSDDVEAVFATRIRAALKPNESAKFDASASKSVSLQCGDSAENLTVARTDIIALGAN